MMVLFLKSQSTVVRRLVTNKTLGKMSEFLNKGYHLFTDNWYNSVSLTEFLSQKKTYVTGTLRADRKRNPKKVMSA